MAAITQQDTPRRGLGAGYWRESAHPLVSLAFVLPMLLIYEGGVLLLGHGAARNGIDVLLRWVLDLLGFGQYFLLPLLTAAILLAWHHTTGRPWRIRAALLPGMFLESAGLGLVLLLLAQVHGALFAELSMANSQTRANDAASSEAASSETASTETASVTAPAITAPAITAPSITAAAGKALDPSWSRMVAYFGAGIYEELLFRLMLLPLTVGLLRLCRVPNGWSLIAALLLTSLIFSAAHYQMFTTIGDEFTWFSFVFRAVAGLFFSLLFLYRGFGIAVGSHALYDILVVAL